MGNVSLESIRFEDCTGLATHVQLELMELVGTRVGIRAFTLPLKQGKSDALKPVAMNVFELHIQPMVSPRPGEIVPLGQPLSVQAFPGQFIVSASLESRGQLIRRTIVDELVVASEDMPKNFPNLGMEEVSFSYFDYHDMAAGAPDTVDLLIVGSLNGAPSDSYRVDGISVATELPWSSSAPYVLSDVVSLRFTVYAAGGVQYGESVLQEASPGLFVRRATGWTTGPPPVNHGSCVQKHSGTIAPRTESAKGGHPPKPPGAAPKPGAGRVAQPVLRIVRPVRVGSKKER